MRGEEKQRQDRRVQRDLEGEPADLVQGRHRERGQEDGDADPRAPPDSEREPSQEKRGGEPGRCAHPTGEEVARLGQPEDRREDIDVGGVLVFAEGSEEEREPHAVLVTARRRDAEGVVGDRRLVDVEPRRIRLLPEEVPGGGEGHEREEESSAHGIRAYHRGP